VAKKSKSVGPIPTPLPLAFARWVLQPGMIHWNGWNFRKIVGFRESNFNIVYCSTNHDCRPGKAFLKKFREASKMKTKHEHIFKQLSATFSSTIVEEWLDMVEIWEADPSKPNPYAEPRSGKYYLVLQC